MFIRILQIRKRINGRRILRWEQPDSNNSIIDGYGWKTGPGALLARFSVFGWLEDEYIGIRRRHPCLTVFRCVFTDGLLFYINDFTDPVFQHVRTHTHEQKQQHYRKHTRPFFYTVQSKNVLRLSLYFWFDILFFYK